MASPSLAALYRYPVKSLGGEAFQSLDVTRRGFRGDRDWMVVDTQGRFLTQRRLTRMALVATQLDDVGTLRLSAPGMSALTVGPPAAQQRIEVGVWGDRIAAVPGGPEADAWLSDFLQQPCRLVAFPADSVRKVDPEHADPTDEVGFADGFPFLLISQASLDDLNGRLRHPVPMLRFRPNLVVEGCDAFAEDGWRRIRIGDVSFRVAKPCSRCIIPTIDPTTGERGREPLQTLMTFRRRDNKVYFGQNLIHDGVGRLEAGMPLEVLG